MKDRRTFYRDSKSLRVLDLRPHGVDAIPVLSYSDDKTIRNGTTEHVHPGCIEIVYCQRGRMPFVADGQDFPIRSGEIFLSQPGQPHWMRCVPRGNQNYRILFQIPGPRQAILGLSQKETHWLSGSLSGISRRVIHGGEAVQRAFETLFAIYDRPQDKTPERAMRLRHASLALLFAVLAASEKGNVVSLNAEVREVVRRMHEHPEQKFPLPEMAREAELSHTTFSSEFRKLTGMTPHAYLIHCRIEKAKAMLERADTLSSAIANMLGFSSARHFTSSFKRSVGVTPTEYRKGRPAQTTS